MKKRILTGEQIAFLCGGNVRAAIIDANAWANQHAPKVKRVRTEQPSFALGNGVSV